MEHQFEKAKIRFRRGDWSRKIDMAIFSKTEIVESLTARELKPEDLGIAIPTLMSIGHHEAQIIMDDLWECGIRPSEGSGSAGQLKSTQDHLKDMRKIVAKQLDVNLDN